ncbi:hypothetical protein P3T76_015550 [Phytophthora citrophthora]|uniref:Crinkler effector protein N-terminal domain-containing protein n=1 Tax=Phytophthora citrophthora TaxID=4793 RepID=A0AAD9LA28_9STRA|nr:hypothetical protein P3T76_015550 [Phytophthora citrophthora]
MVKLFCAVVGAVGSAFEVDIAEDASVSALKEAIKNKKKNALDGVDPDDLQLFLAKTADGGWLRSDDPDVTSMRSGAIPEQVKKLLNEEIDPAEEIGDLFGGAPTKKTIHVLVVVLEAGVGSALLQKVNTVEYQDVWYGLQGSVGRGEGIDLNDERTLSRSALTADIIDRLDETHVVLVKSPPMTGKTSLTTLVSRTLVTKHREERKKSVVFNVSALGISEDETFEDIFKQQCEVSWADAKSTLPSHGYMVYIVLDEAQVIYRQGTSSPRHKSTMFWQLVKYVLNNAAYSVRILMFAAYGSGPAYTLLATPVQFDKRMVFTIEELNFSHDEVQEYVSKWFKGIAFLERLSALEAFCANLEELTGGHVGLCATAIHTLNEVYFSRKRSGSDLPSADAWIRMLQSGSLYQANDNELFESLISTRAVWILKTLSTEELDRLERIAYGANPGSDDNIVEQCLQKGILVQTEQRYLFSSPVMWRFFVKMRVGHIVRALDAPKTLPEMVARVMRSIDYNSIRQTLGRSLSSDIPLERAWQMEFYKAAYRCTPSTFVTSADVGALFGSSGFVDFTIHGGDIFWGIELLREASNLVEHIERFSPGGSYFSLKLSDFCLIDFRRVVSIDHVAMERIAADMRDCDKLFVVCYDARVAGVVVFNSAMDVVYRI